MSAPEWYARAACRGRGHDAWFPGSGQDQTEALGVCARCPVRAECLAAGAGEFGIWGGLAERQRRRVLAAAKRQVS